MRGAFTVACGVTAFAACACGATSAAAAEQRFPPPEFSTDYTLPTPTAPNPEASWIDTADVVLLAAALAIAAWLALARRSRNGMVALSIGCLAYFGFVREGCVCAIGSVQNVSLALADPTYTIPLSVLAFFLLPLLFAAFVGRAFCAGVCPLGAIQDLVLVRPVRLPGWADEALGLLPYLYLGAAVLLAVTASRFIICAYDPFVGFFRFSGEAPILVFGAVLLAIGMFVGRPYCRFLCPYGVLLRQLSRFSKWHLSIAPRRCIACGLCADACPFGAIREPTPGAAAARPTAAMRRRFVTTLLVAPVVVVLAGWLAASFAGHLASLNPEVADAEALARHGPPPGASAATTAASFEAANAVRATFRLGGWIIGGVIGLVVVARLIRLTVMRPSDDYDADRAACYSCARCVPRCPKERQRRGEPVVLPPDAPDAIATGAAT